MSDDSSSDEEVDTSNRQGMGEDEFYVERVLDKKFNEDKDTDCGLSFKVKWQDYDNPEDDTWEPITNMTSALTKVKKFLDRPDDSSSIPDPSEQISPTIIRKQQAKLVKKKEVQEVLGITEGAFIVKWSDQQVSMLTTEQFEKMPEGPQKMMFFEALFKNEEMLLQERRLQEEDTEEEIDLDETVRSLHIVEDSIESSESAPDRTDTASSPVRTRASRKRASGK